MQTSCLYCAHTFVDVWLTSSCKQQDRQQSVQLLIEQPEHQMLLQVLW